jgi:NAD+ synthase
VAEHLGIPQEIIQRVPTTDTYSAEQTQEEFFYEYPFEQLDLLWYGFENNYDPSEVADALEMDANEVESIFKNFERRAKTTDYLRNQAINDYVFL